jgi:hypothetical protein
MDHRRHCVTNLGLRDKLFAVNFGLSQSESNGKLRPAIPKPASGDSRWGVGESIFLNVGDRNTNSKMPRERPSKPCFIKTFHHLFGQLN